MYQNDWKQIHTYINGGTSGIFGTKFEKKICWKNSLVYQWYEMGKITLIGFKRQNILSYSSE